MYFKSIKSQKNSGLSLQEIIQIYVYLTHNNYV